MDKKRTQIKFKYIPREKVVNHKKYNIFCQYKYYNNHRITDNIGPNLNLVLEKYLLKGRAYIYKLLIASIISHATHHPSMTFKLMSHHHPSAINLMVAMIIKDKDSNDHIINSVQSGCLTYSVLIHLTTDAREVHPIPVM